MPPSKIINVHTHMHKTQDIKARVALWEQCGLVKVCVMVLGLEPNDHTFTNDEFVAVMREYKDLIVGFGRVDMGWDPDEAEDVDKLKEQGFHGLKCIRASYAYDNEIYHPIYERAEALGMPILFHTGFLAIHENDGADGVSTDKMRAMRMDTLGRAFPDLRIMCGHIGMPLYEEGLSVITHFERIWGEYSGGGGQPAKATELRRLLKPLPGVDMADPDQNLALVWYKKLCFSTDNPDPPRWLDLNERLLAELEIPADLQERFYWQNATEWLGIKL
ncbi:MAG: amidohydrolase family protein [Planctomycetota bacterium]